MHTSTWIAHKLPRVAPLSLLSAGFCRLRDQEEGAGRRSVGVQISGVWQLFGLIRSVALMWLCPHPRYPRHLTPHTS